MVKKFSMFYWEFAWKYIPGLILLIKMMNFWRFFLWKTPHSFFQLTPHNKVNDIGNFVIEWNFDFNVTTTFKWRVLVINWCQPVWLSTTRMSCALLWVTIWTHRSKDSQPNFFRDNQQGGDRENSWLPTSTDYWSLPDNKSCSYLWKNIE